MAQASLDLSVKQRLPFELLTLLPLPSEHKEYRQAYTTIPVFPLILPSHAVSLYGSGEIGIYPTLDLGEPPRTGLSVVFQPCPW